MQEYNIKITDIPGFNEKVNLLNSLGINIQDSDIYKIVMNIYVTFCENILKGICYEITHEYDPPFDSSGSLVRDIMLPEDLLKKYINEFNTLEEWADQVYIGHSEATYISGYGLGYPTYESEFTNQINSTFYSIVDEILSDREDDVDSIIDGIVFEMSSILYNYIGSTSIEECWRIGQKVTEEKIQREKIERDERSRIYNEQYQISKEITNKYFNNQKSLWSNNTKKITAENCELFMKYFNQILSILTIIELKAIERHGLVDFCVSLSNKVKLNTLKNAEEVVRLFKAV